VHANSAAEKAGLKIGDTIIGVNGNSTPSIGSLVSALEPHIGQDTTIDIERDGTKIQAQIHPGEQVQAGKRKPLLGVAWQSKKMGLKDAFVTGWQATWGLITQTFGALKALGKSREGLGGPLMLICQVTQFAGMGMKMFLFMLAFISINLAVFNVLPLPIFDGGQVLFFTIEALLRRPLSDKTRESIHYYTWLLVIALVVYLTFKDVIKISGWF
jgi:regulator of sigma E protease